MISYCMAEKSNSRYQGLWGKTRKSLRWLVPGLGVKRWLIPIILGTTLLSVGFAFFLLDLYRNAPEVQWYLDLLATAALRFLPRPLRIIIFGSLGVSLIVIGTDCRIDC